MSSSPRVIAMLVAMTALSQFYRASQSVIAPELMRELSLSPRRLGIASGSFFLAIGLAQVPIGSLFDRYGPVTAYGILIVAHGRSLFPDHLVGRGVTTVNLAQVAGTTLLPVLTGAIVGAFPATTSGSPEIACRLAFAAIACRLAAGLALYQRAREVTSA